MSKVTTKLQLTLPKALAVQYGIHAGSEVRFEAAGPVIVLRPAGEETPRLSLTERLALFDAATDRLEARGYEGAGRREWSREDLYDRALAR